MTLVPWSLALASCASAPEEPTYTDRVVVEQQGSSFVIPAGAGLRPGLRPGDVSIQLLTDAPATWAALSIRTTDGEERAVPERHAAVALRPRTTWFGTLLPGDTTLSVVISHSEDVMSRLPSLIDPDAVDAADPGDVRINAFDVVPR